MRKTLTSEIPLMSRDAEMDWILAKLKRPEPAAFMLAGAPGVGKTRLAAEAARSAAGLGFTTAQAVASRAAAAIPFGPFAPFLPEAGYSPGDLLGLLRKAATPSWSEPARIAGCWSWTTPSSSTRARPRWSTNWSRRGPAACWPACGPRGPAPEPVTALWKDGLAERIDLTTWGESETEAVLSAVLGGPVAISSVRRLWEVSQGNALYLRELLIGAVDSGALTETGGIWSLRQPLTAPGRLVELVAARLSGQVAHRRGAGAARYRPPRAAGPGGPAPGRARGDHRRRPGACAGGPRRRMDTGSAPDLEAAGHTLEALGACLLAAEAYLAAAAAYRSDGYARPASALTRRAGELAAQCGDVSTPGLSFGTQTERLTRREREVAGMAAAGASSREIAAKLVLSVRTVDNHLQSVYSKLGVTSREELARVLRS